MSKRGAKEAALLIAMAMSGANGNIIFSGDPKPLYPKSPSMPKQPIIPAGCKEYIFQIDDHIIFTCIALNYKSAFRKYQNHQKRINKI